MRKNNLIRLLIFGIAFMMFSCSEDLYEEDFNSSNKTTIKEMKFDELFKDKKFNNLLNKVTNYKLGSNSSIARSAFENQNGFTISNEVVKIIANDSLTSYTMLIERDSSNLQSTDFENLVIQETNLGNNEKAFLIKYMPNQIIPTTHNSFTLDGTIQKSKLAFTSFNKGIYENTIQSDCYVDVLMCNESWSGGVTGASHVAGEGCKNVRFLYVRKVQVLCADEGVGSGGGGGGDSGGFGDPYGGGTGGGTGSSGGGTGSSDPNDSEAEEDVITSPVKPGLDDGDSYEKTPCDLLKKLNKDLGFVGRTKLLAIASNQWSFEYLNTIYNHTTPSVTNAYSYQNFNGSADVPFAKYDGNTSLQGVIHSHYSGILSIFSVQDIVDLYEKMKIPEITDNFFLGVVCPQGNAYIMQVNDRAAFIAFGDKHLSTKNKQDDFDRDICQKKYNIKMGNSASDNEKGFVKMMSELNFGTNVAKETFVPSTVANTPNQNLFNNWRKLSYNPTTEQIEINNCN